MTGHPTTAVNFEVQSYTTKAADSYAKPPEEQIMKHQTRFMGIQSSANHKSETQLQGLVHTFTSNVELYNKSPLAQTDAIEMTVADIIGNVVGMHSDLAEDQKKYARITAEFKKEHSNESLGRKLLRNMTSDQLFEILHQARQSTIEKLGGEAAWNSLSPQMQRVHTDRYTAEVACKLGELAYGKMSDEEKEEFDLFIWAGCCMHKLLNSVKGTLSETTAADLYSIPRL